MGFQKGMLTAPTPADTSKSIDVAGRTVDDDEAQMSQPVKNCLMLTVTLCRPNLRDRSDP